MGVMGDVVIPHRIATDVMAEIFPCPPGMAYGDFRRQSLVFYLLANRNVVDSTAVFACMKFAPNP